jgi:hypothetical protein
LIGVGVEFDHFLTRQTLSLTGIVWHLAHPRLVIRFLLQPFHIEFALAHFHALLQTQSRLPTRANEKSNGAASSMKIV